MSVCVWCRHGGVVWGWCRLLSVCLSGSLSFRPVLSVCPCSPLSSRLVFSGILFSSVQVQVEGEGGGMGMDGMVSEWLNGGWRAAGKD